MGIGYLFKCIDMKRIAPDGIRPGIRFERRHNRIMIEAYHLSLLCETEVTVNILDGKGAIGSRSHTFNIKMATTVGLRYSQHRLGLEGRICHITIKSDFYPLYRFQIACIKHISGYLKRINLIAGRETVSIVTHRIPLIVIADGIAEIDGVSGVLFQRVLQLHYDFLTRGIDLWHLQLRRRYRHLARGILKLDEFIEIDRYLLRLHIS